MMILSELRKTDELDKLSTPGIILYEENLSCAFKDKFSISSIKEIKNKTDKKVFLSLMPLYHDNDYEKLKETISELQNLDGFFFQDLGLVSIFNELGIIDKAIYYPLTFINNYYDAYFLSEKFSLKHFQISKEITLSEIDEILLKNSNVCYSYSIFGYQNIFYSLRQHLSNYKEHVSLKEDLHNSFDLTIKEETRDEFYKVLEDKYGFYIFKDKIFLGFNYLKHFDKCEYLILNREFISDEMYFDTISLFNNDLPYDEYLKRYSICIDEGYLFKPVGLLKEKKDE